MKTKDLAKAYGFDARDFDQWLKQSGYQYSGGITGLTIQDEQADGLANAYDDFLDEQDKREQQQQERARQEQAAAAQAAADKKRALASMLITSGFHFDGYTITKYSG